MYSFKPKILIIDDTKFNIIYLSSLLKDIYNVIYAMDGETGISMVKTEQPDLILLDIVMPGMDGYETFKRIKELPERHEVPIIFLSAKSEDEDISKGLEMGAVDYITKPVNTLILFSRIKNHLLMKRARDFLKDNNEYLESEIKRRTKEIEKIQEVSITAMASLAETRDNDTGKHIQRTQQYVKELALELSGNDLYNRELTKEKIQLIVKSTPLHDIGKVGIPDNILLKPGRLTPEEFDIMKTHTVIGKMAIEKAEKIIDRPETYLTYAKIITYYHHEKWDGSGYPEKLSGESIPLAARIMAVADVYDALVSKRIYKDAFSHENAVKIIKDDANKHFDPVVVDAFIKLERVFFDISERLKD